MNEQTTQQLATEPQPQPIESVPSVESAPSAFDDALNELRTQNAELKNQLRLRSARDAIVSALTAENARSPELLFEHSTSRLVFDDEGDLKNTAELISSLRQRFPEQFVTETPPPTPSPPPSINSGAGRLNIRLPLTKEMLARMEPHDIARLDWNDVRQVMES